MPNTDKIDISICDIESLPCPPHVAMKVIRISNNPDKGVRDLCEVLELDASLCTSILKIANSTAYSRGRQFDGIMPAVSVMGAKATAAVALGFSLKQSIPSWSHPSGLNDKLLWRHSVASAVASRSLAKVAGYHDEQRAFLCGLLSRIGQLVLFTSAPEPYGRVLDESPTVFPSPQLEQQTIGINHHIVGHHLLENWNLPAAICDVIRYWNQPKESGLDCDGERLASIVCASDAVADLLSDDDKGRGLQRARELALELLGIDATEIERLFADSERELKETLAIFGDSAGSEIDCESILDEGRQQLILMSIGLATDLASAKQSTTQLEAENRSLEASANTDALTGLPNRAALTREADAIWDRYSVSRDPHFTVVMADVDHFKSFNDTHGHKVGDEVLIAVAKTLDKCARGTDLVARYGGEEFTIILNHASYDEAVIAGERFRSAIEQMVVVCDGTALQVTVSFGAACSKDFPDANSFENLLELADQALYVAKRDGRNQVSFAGRTDRTATPPVDCSDTPTAESTPSTPA